MTTVSAVIARASQRFHGRGPDESAVGELAVGTLVMLVSVDMDERTGNLAYYCIEDFWRSYSHCN